MENQESQPIQDGSQANPFIIDDDVQSTTTEDFQLFRQQWQDFMQEDIDLPATPGQDSGYETDIIYLSE